LPRAGKRLELKEIVSTIIRGQEAVKFPLVFESGFIWDANDHHILDLRGWGCLQHHSKGTDAAVALQHAIGIWIVKTLNAEAARDGLITV
jgi:hypothetical protein